jgi:RNA polymerase sigma-70 factor (ECF subfamily)
MDKPIKPLAHNDQEAGHAVINMSDEEVLTEIAVGRQDAISVIFDRYGRLIFTIANRILRDSGEAEEIMQGVLIDVIRSARKFDRERGSAKVWLMQYAYHRSIRRKQQLESRHFYSGEVLESVTDEIVKQTPRPALGLFPQERGRLIREAMQVVDEKRRKTIEMTFYEGLTAEEIATRTGESAVVVRHNLYRALAKLRAHIEARPRSEREKTPDNFRSEGGQIAHVRA